MGELLLISGPNSSGKSRFAERYIDAAAGPERPRFYIAAMVPVTEDNRRRVEKHRAQRAGLGFQTLELPQNVSAAPVTPDGAVLLEDVSNLLANAMFGSGGDAAAVCSDIFKLRDRCALLVCVTISGLTEAGVDDAGTVAYIRALNALNAALLEASDAAAALSEGVPGAVKGDWNGFIEGYRRGVFHL